MIKINSRVIGVALTIGLLFSCASFPSVNVDPSKNNRSTYRQDLAECKEDHPVSSVGLHYNRWAECMNLKGWK